MSVDSQYRPETLSSGLQHEVEKYVHDPEPFVGGGLTLENTSSSSLSRSIANEPLRRLMNTPIGSVTSRDQIIDPYKLVPIESYNVGTDEGRALYEQDLAQARQYAERQEAVYQEWYNSAEQKILRERQAGRNPDLTDVVGSDASDTDSQTGSPFDNLLSPSEVSQQKWNNAFGIVNSIVGAIGSAAGLASTFSTLGLNKIQKEILSSQSDSLQIDNLSKLEGLYHKDISGRLSSALSKAAATGASLDIESWFADDNNFRGLFEAYAPSDTPQYRAVLERARSRSQEILSQAYSTSGQSASNQTAFAQALSNPYYSDDVVLQISYLEPVMDAIEKLRLLDQDYQMTLSKIKSQYVSGLDIAGASELANAQYKYQTDYFNGFDGNEVAAAEQRMKIADSIIKEATGAIYKNNLDIYNSDKYSTRGMAAAYNIMSGAHMSWQEFLVAYGMTVPPNPNNDGKLGFDDPIEITQNGKTSSYPSRPFTIFDFWFNK